MPYSFRNFTRRAGFSRGVNPPTGGGGPSPTVFTLVLDNLSTRFAENTTAAATIKFKLVADPGDHITDFVYLDASQGVGNASSTLDAVGDVATALQDTFNGPVGFSGVTVSGVATVPGDQWDFTITFPGALGVTDLNFHASSQWYPTITLTEAVTQDGATTVAGQQEVVTITASGAFDTTADTNGNSVALDSNGDYLSNTAASGWTASAPAGTSVTFTQDVAAAVETSKASGSGTVTVDVEGVTAVTGAQEIHTITATPVYPSGGSWKPVSTGDGIAYNSSATEIDSNIESAVGAGVTVTDSGSAGISDGVVTVTWDLEDSQNDAALSPVNVDLTALEITHSITPV